MVLIYYRDLFFPMDIFLVHSTLQEVNGAQWKLSLCPIPWNKLDDIENDDSSFSGDIAK